MTSNKLSKRIRALLDYEDNITTMIASARFGGNGECDCSKDRVKMNVSENRLVYDVLREKMQKCTRSETWEDDMFMYSERGGVPELKEAIAKYLRATTRAVMPIDPKQMVVLNGADAGLEAFGHIICDAGEAVLLPAPFYSGIHRNLKTRFDVNVVPIPLSSEPKSGESKPFELTVERAVKAYKTAIQEGIVVKGLFLVNPNNPLGDVYSRQLVLDLLKFANRYDLHVVLDEVYMNCIFEEGIDHYSIFQFKEDEIPDLQKVHFIWTFSKDLAMGGMRISANYTWNEDVFRSLYAIAHFHPVPTGWQRIMTKLLSDTDWCTDVFLPTSVKRLKEAFDHFTTGLTKLGVPFHGGPAGLYLWADFSKFLSARTAEAEIAFHHKVIKAGVEFSPSLLYGGSERGWFRVVFARKLDILELALERIQRALQS
ncbi:probable inactive 1-aminocyclopropane-1-carboxylate synthase-like protein 2 [Asterias rubens]|uniref:probable inactive 1-aminocyclopropane-1-carboxylate synthase-like protein 2 n=1 Tax=Asterias rubens TaxID=7604 RepID=UPI0014551975|nr:probable inactive 1-aminocyclopropane-1-carboxylate synthase-like protein 2 [Asterias rubens]